MRQVFNEKKRIFTFFFLGAAVLGLSSCGQVEIESRWRTSDIVIDGSAGDWGGLLWAIEDTGVFVGVLNDDQNVYLCVESVDRGAADEALRRGLTVWFDPKGGKGQVLGLRFPLGKAWNEFEGSRGRRPDGEPGEEEPGGGLPGRRPEIRADEIEILGPGRDEKARMPLSRLKGIEISMGMESGILVYELKVPLAKTADIPYAASAAPGGFLGVGFESSKPDLSSVLRGGGRMTPRIGGRMPGRGGMMGGRGMQNIDLPERFKLWLKAHLAAPAS